MLSWLFNLFNSQLPRRRTGRDVRVVRARYDAAVTNEDNRRHWAHADGLSANQAFVSVRLQGTVSGQVLRVYVHDDGTRTGPWVELEFKDAPQTTVLRASTGQTAIYPVRPLEQHLLTICLEGTSLIANLDPQPGFIPALRAWVRGTLLSPATGKYLVCQLRGVGGPATFDQVQYRRLSVSRPIFPFAPGKCGSCYAVCTCCEQEIMPTEMLLELEGLVGYPFPDGSSCCVNYNQAYFLGALTNCFFDWDRGAIDACTKPGFVNLSWECFPSSVRITASLYYQTDYPFPGATLTWRTTLPRPVDCLGFDRLPLPFLSQSGSNQRCDPSSSIAYLTSL